MKVGDKLPADQITGRTTVLNTLEDVSWAFSVHIKQPDKAQYNCLILVGNEDAPDAIWGHKQVNPHYRAKFTLLYLA